MPSTSHDARVSLGNGWTFASTEAQLEAPDADALDALVWRACSVPGTVAAARRTLDDLHDTKGAADESLGTHDHWYRCRFPAPDRQGETSLCFAGLATVADVWLNGEHVLHSDNMFVAHDIPVSGKLRDDNELLIRFHALQPILNQRKPRPRWRTALVKSQTLRFVRTTLLGHVNSWCSPVIAVGPWRDVELVITSGVCVTGQSAQASVTGDTGVVELTLQAKSIAPITGANLIVGDQSTELSVETTDTDHRVHGRAVLANVDLWWPHTHGEQPLYPARIELQSGDYTTTIDLGRLGFRSIEPVNNDRPGLVVNGVDVQCRGSCWTTLDLLRLDGDAAAYRRALLMARDGGMNMIRIVGTMIYEHDEFYRLCDELGILVWQDFMFANMDYPIADPEFLASIKTEADQFLARTQSNCCLAVLCGGSEVEQQAAMLGLPAEAWTNDWFARDLPELCRVNRPDLPYWPSSPTGGDLPFHVGTGIAHYFGVGAYQRPLEDARLHAPVFAAECLAFSNVPEPVALAEMTDGALIAPHDPTYKASVPRDPGAGWDFTDVTDHYVEHMFGLDTRALRYADLERYYQCCRVAIGEVLKTVAGGWRASDCKTRGALTWFFRDLVPGAGWGLVDAGGRPKSAWFYLRRAWQPRAVWLVDVGLDGLNAHIANDPNTELRGTLEVTVLGANDTVVATVSTAVEIAPRSHHTCSIDALIGRFCDTTYAYRFGKRTVQVVATRLIASNGSVVSEDFYFPERLPSEQHIDPRLEAMITPTEAPAGESRFDLTFRSERFCQAVAVDAPGFEPSDNYFHLLPGTEKTIQLRGPDAQRLRGYAQPFNSATSVRLSAP
tara:strand:+ start:37838 stop:40354 length:2517 start_codon:yes stop_codon:yes gene_type:complete